jgi:hypothetical protein
MTFVDAKNPAGKNPPRIRPHRHTYVPLNPQIPLSSRNLVKLAQATPPWAACLAVCAKKRRFYICGLFDQEVHHRNALNQEGGSRIKRPGLYQVEVTGDASLAINDGRKLLVTLNQNTVVRMFHDVLNSGPIAKCLFRYTNTLGRKVRHCLAGELSRKALDTYFGESATAIWLQTLSRILLSIKRMKHGGALLLTPSSSLADLSIKYMLNYDKTEGVLESHIVSSIRNHFATRVLHKDYYDKQVNVMPVLSHLRESITETEREDALKAELGCAHFIASLAGVDGLILLSGGLVVKGFGVEITRRMDPQRVFVAGDSGASKTKLRRVDLTHFGTRHRSMMRYCDRHAGSIGFVVSQDGDIRAMTRLKNGLVIWENIRLQEVEIDTEDHEAADVSVSPTAMKRRADNQSNITEKRMARGPSTATR